MENPLLVDITKIIVVIRNIVQNSFKYADPDTGVGTLKPSTDFMENDLMLQVDCLREWIYDLEQIHDVGAELLAQGKSVYSKGLFKELYDERTGKTKQL